MKKIYAAAAAAIAIAAAVPLVASAAGGWHGGWHGDRHGYAMRDGHDRMERHRGDHAVRRLARALDTFDANGDGSIAQQEVDAYRAGRLRRFDANGDGQLSLDEYQALWLDAMRERMVDRFQSHDDDGDGQVTIAEFEEPTAHMVMRFDRNGDGTVNVADLHGRHGAAMRAAAPAGNVTPADQGGAGATAPEVAPKQ